MNECKVCGREKEREERKRERRKKRKKNFKKWLLRGHIYYNNPPSREVNSESKNMLLLY